MKLPIRQFQPLLHRQSRHCLQRLRACLCSGAGG